MKRAWRSLVDAVQTESGLELQVVDDAKYYLRATGAAKVPPEGTDDLEFLLTSDSSGVTALYRSATRQRLFVYPLQQPVPNQDSHLARLRSVRKKLGWKERGYASDGEMEKNMGAQQVQNFFGLRLRGVSVPEEYDD